MKTSTSTTRGIEICLKIQKKNTEDQTNRIRALDIFIFLLLFVQTTSLDLFVVYPLRKEARQTWTHSDDDGNSDDDGGHQKGEDTERVENVEDVELVEDDDDHHPEKSL